MLKKIIKDILKCEEYPSISKPLYTLFQFYNIGIEIKQWNEPQFPHEDGGEHFAWKCKGQLNSDWSRSFLNRSEMITDLIFFLKKQKVLLKYKQ